MLVCALDLGFREDTVALQGHVWKIAHSVQGWLGLDAQLPEDCEIVFEGRCEALEVLLAHRALYSLDPARSAKLRKALRENKDDRNDALDLAGLFQVFGNQFKRIMPMGQDVLNLRRSVRMRRTLVQQQTQLLQMLQQENPRLAKQKEAQWLESFKDSLHMSLVNVLETVRKEIRRMEALLEEQIARVPACMLLRSIKGMGLVLSAEIVAELQGLKSLGACSQVRAYAGTAPVTLASGKHRAVYTRRRCNHRARNALYLFAFTSLRHHAWARRFYDAGRSRGKHHSAALIALANRWLAVLVAMVKHQQPYDSVRKEHTLCTAA